MADTSTALVGRPDAAGPSATPDSGTGTGPNWVPTGQPGVYYDPTTFEVAYGPDAQGNFTPAKSTGTGVETYWNPTARMMVHVNPDGTSTGPDPRSADQKAQALLDKSATSDTPEDQKAYTLGQRNKAQNDANTANAAAEADRQRQLDFSNTLNDTITNPNAPSVAREQLAQATQANEATQLSQAAGATGENAFLARQGASRNIAAANQTEAQQKALLRAQEVASAQSNMGTVLGQVGNEDISRYSTGSAAASDYDKTLRSFDQADAAAAAQADKEKNEDRNYRLDLATKSATAGGSAAGAVASDRNVKKDIHAEPDDKVMAFLSAIQPDSFRYKGENPESPEHHGVMAQDLEQSEIGRSLVHQSPHGKVVDVGTAAMAALAAAASLHRRLARVEGKKGGARG